MELRLARSRLSFHRRDASEFCHCDYPAASELGAKRCCRRGGGDTARAANGSLSNPCAWIHVQGAAGLGLVVAVEQQLILAPDQCPACMSLATLVSPDLERISRTPTHLGQHNFKASRMPTNTLQQQSKEMTTTCPESRDK